MDNRCFSVFKQNPFWWHKWYGSFLRGFLRAFVLGILWKWYQNKKKGNNSLSITKILFINNFFFFYFFHLLVFLKFWMLFQLFESDSGFFKIFFHPCIFFIHICFFNDFWNSCHIPKSTSMCSFETHKLQKKIQKYALIWQIFTKILTTGIKTKKKRKIDHSIQMDHFEWEKLRFKDQDKDARYIYRYSVKKWKVNFGRSIQYDSNDPTFISGK